MAIDEPSWWYDEAPRWQTKLLRPAAGLYGAIAARRLKSAKAYRSRFPVICVGNFTAGGTGKTPAALRIADLVRDLGFAPVFLTRGYGGRIDGPVDVDPRHHSFIDVGDEPLLLAAHARTVIAKVRATGAAFIDKTAADNSIIVMDDGLQNASIAKDVTIALVDAKRGLGNGAVIPAGPLRAPIAAQAPLADVVIVNGDPAARETEAIVAALPGFRGAMMGARVVPAIPADALRGQRLVAFAGIANPHRFFALLKKLGAEVVQTAEFRDHHAFSAADVARLIALADEKGAQLATTEKDAVRLKSVASGQALLKCTLTVPVRLELLDDGTARLSALISERLAARRAQP